MVAQIQADTMEKSKRENKIERDSRDEWTERKTDKQKGEDGMVYVNVRNLW